LLALGAARPIKFPTNSENWTGLSRAPLTKLRLVVIQFRENIDWFRRVDARTLYFDRHCGKDYKENADGLFIL
jgi:hypothetical protein